MKWFLQEFLPSLESRMTNPEYQNQCILTERQAEICMKYMEQHQRKDCSYNIYFHIYKTETDSKEYMMTKRGKYYFLRVFSK